MLFYEERCWGGLVYNLGFSMTFFEEYARRFFFEARKGMERARKAFRDEDYPDAVFHAQQCVEKAVEAMIESRREYVYNHGPRLASIFSRVFKDDWSEEFDDVVDIIGWFSEYYTRSRYPFQYQGKVISPDEFITEDIARDALNKAVKVLKIVEGYLRERKIL